MAKTYYDSTKADYVKLQFKCNCGKVLNTELIPVKYRYDNKYENTFEYEKPVICNKCVEKHILRFYDDTCEIPSLLDDKAIIYIHEIPLEYAEGYNTALIDYAGEIVKIQELVQNVNRQDVLNKEIIYQMALTHSISVMDAFLGNTFRYNVMTYKLFRNQFLTSNNEKENEEKMRKLVNQSFQNLEKISIPYYKKAFGVVISSNDIIQNAVKIRNAIIHNNGREEDGYKYDITEACIIQLLSEISSLVQYVSTAIVNAISDKIVLKNRVKLEEQK